MTETTRQTLTELARHAGLAASAAGGGRAYRFAATATPDVVLALVNALDAVDRLCDGSDTAVSRDRLKQAIDSALGVLDGGLNQSAA
jgi:hypothetical protein